MSIGNEFENKRLTKENEDLKKEVSTLKQLVGDLQAYIGNLKKHREFSLYSAIVNAEIIRSKETLNVNMKEFAIVNPELSQQVKTLVDSFDNTLYPNNLDFTKVPNNA